MKKLVNQFLEHSTEIFIGIIFIGFIWAFGERVVRRIETIHYKEVIYAYACPTKGSSSKCYKVRADFEPGYWMNKGNDYEPGMFTKIYFENGDSVDFISCGSSNKTYICQTENEADGEWELQISRVEKVRK